MARISSYLRIALTGSCLIPAAAFASDSTGAAGDIVVTATSDRYVINDGSSATKTPTALIDVPQAVTVVTREQLDDQNFRNLNDALRYVPGVTLETGEGHRDQVFIRGQSSTADFFLDGLRDDAQYYRSLYNVERIEVLKGPNALIFGRGGGGGAINRVTKKADPAAALTQVQGAADNYGAFNLAADLNQPLGLGVAGRLNATYETFANSRDFYDGRFFGISPTVTAQLAPTTRMTATYSYDDDRRVTDRGLPSLNGRPLSGYDSTFFGDPNYNDSFTRVHVGRTTVDHAISDAVSLNAALQYANYDKFYANVEPIGATATTVRLQGYEAASTRQNLIGQVNLVAKFETGGIGHTLLLGAEGGGQESTASRNNVRFGTLANVTVPLAQTIPVPAFTLALQSASNSQLSTLSAYAQEQLDLGIVQLVAGVRFDRFDIDTTNRINAFAASRVDEGVSPRLGVILKPRAEVSLYASYSQSFLPQSGDQFSVLSPLTAALDPETFRNVEAGFKWALRPELLLTGAVFRLDRANSPAPDPANPGFVLLTGETRVEGFEASLAGEVLPSLALSLGYTYLDGQVRSTTAGAPAGRRLAQLPEHQASAWGRYDFSERLGIGAGVIHQSEQFASLSNAVVLPAYTRADAALFINFSPRLGLQLNVENLFDAKYYSSAHGDNNIQPGEPLTATVSAKLKL